MTVPARPPPAWKSLSRTFPLSASLSLSIFYHSQTAPASFSCARDNMFGFIFISMSNISDQQFHQRCTHCLPPVAGSSTYLSKYNRTSRSLSSGPGRAKFTISSIRSLMAQSNCSGWLLAKTSMNLQGGTRFVLTKRNPERNNSKFKLWAKDWCLLVALFSSAIQEGIQGGSEFFTDLLLKNRFHHNSELSK